MKIEVIKYKKFRSLNQYVFLFLYVVFILDFYIRNYIPSIYNYNTFLTILIVNLLASILLNFVIPKTISFGYLLIDEDNQINYISSNEKKTIDAKKIIMFYGGHTKEVFSYLEMFVNGYRFRNGTDNYLVINDEIYQIYIEDKLARNKLKAILLELEELGVDFEWKKTYFGKRLSRKYIAENTIDNK